MPEPTESRVGGREGPADIRPRVSQRLKSEGAELRTNDLGGAGVATLSQGTR